MAIREMLERSVKIGASDLHITVGRPPIFRVNGNLVTFPEDKVLMPDDTKALLEPLIPNKHLMERLIDDGQADFSSSYPAIGRFRANVYFQRGSYTGAFRIIPFQIPPLDTLGLPPAVSELMKKDRGLILVTGPTGSGKSTTLAAMINEMNKVKSLNIITLEDPIEYLHRHGTCVINQREVGVDTSSFSLGLRAALRQDPDVILVGEMRDLETISTAVTAAETGHLVLATLHSSSAAQTIDRIVDVFPPHQQSQIRIQLAANIQGILTQQLIPRQDGKGRVVAVEFLIATGAIRNLIRDAKTHQIYSALQMGAAQGMMTMEKALKLLVQKGAISYEEGISRAASKELFESC